jgi:hypothetical protein
MRAPVVDPVVVSLELFPLDNLFEVECPKCSAPLVLHQPDIDLPEHMLGVCSECQAWYLLNASAGVMALLPDLARVGKS